MIAIDPGAGGGIAWRDRDGAAQAVPMPEGMAAQVDAMRGLVAALPAGVGAVVERVGGYMPGNSGPAAATFARHCGHVEAALYCLGVPLLAWPTPQKWMRELGAWPKEKGDRKRAIKEWAARRFPRLRVTLATADALALLVWGEAHAGAPNTMNGNPRIANGGAS